MTHVPTWLSGPARRHVPLGTRWGPGRAQRRLGVHLDGGCLSRAEGHWTGPEGSTPGRPWRWPHGLHFPFGGDKRGDPGILAGSAKQDLQAWPGPLPKRGECSLGWGRRVRDPRLAQPHVPSHGRPSRRPLATPATWRKPASFCAHQGPACPTWLECPEPSALRSLQISGSEPSGPAEGPAPRKAKCISPARVPYHCSHRTGGGGAPLWGLGATATVAQARTDCPFRSGCVCGGAEGRRLVGWRREGGAGET